MFLGDLRRPSVKSPFNSCNIDSQLPFMESWTFLDILDALRITPAVTMKHTKFSLLSDEMWNTSDVISSRKSHQGMVGLAVESRYQTTIHDQLKYHLPYLENISTQQCYEIPNCLGISYPSKKFIALMLRSLYIPLSTSPC